MAQVGDGWQLATQQDADGRPRKGGDDLFEVRSGGIKMEINLEMPEVLNRVVDVPAEA